ncbi:hypothetical protein SpCBS45565_g01158 [Spizellomyces sp. 'palustris']|nr:hypothetical protein SpCBS45565_g01158 [Spizellomyces sp. 'palustris']
MALYDRNLTRFPHPSPHLSLLAKNPSLHFLPDTDLWWPSYSFRQETGLFIGEDFFYGSGKFQVRYFVPKECVLMKPDETEDANMEILEMNVKFLPADWKRNVLDGYLAAGHLRFMVGCLHFTAEVEGPPAFVHGGATFTAFDQLLGVLVHYYNLYIPHMTLTLTIDYKRPMPLSGTQYYKIWIEKIEGKKVFVEGYIFDMDLLENETELDVATADFEKVNVPPALRRAEIRGIFFRIGESNGKDGLAYLEEEKGRTARPKL